MQAHDILVESLYSVTLKVDFRFTEHTRRDLIDAARTYYEIDVRVVSGDVLYHEHHNENQTIHLRKIVIQ